MKPLPATATSPTPRPLLVATMVLGLFAAVPSPLHAGIVRWTGTGGGGDLWSDSGNWENGLAPVNGDDIIFGASASPQARLDFSLQIGSFTFAPDANLTAIHVGTGTAATLTLSGAGIINDPSSNSGGPIRQDFYADASSGPTGGTIRFTNNASVTGSKQTNLNASGATVAGGGGGNIIFQDHSSTASNFNFTSLNAYGGTVAGAGGGTITLRDDAVSQGTTGINVGSGTASGAAGGQFTAQDRAQIFSNINVFAGTDGGLGGRVDFHNDSVLHQGLIQSNGATSLQTGAEAVTRFFDASTLNGIVTNYAGNGDGMAGARLELHGQAVFASLGTQPGSDNVSIGNLGATAAGGLGGRTDFYDHASITGTLTDIGNNTAAEGAQAGSHGGMTVFHDNSRAGQATIFNQGAVVGGAGTTGGQTFFQDSADAEDAFITSNGGQNAGAPGGRVEFSSSSTANHATLTANGGTGGGQGGMIVFRDTASGGTAQVILDGDGTLDLSPTQLSALSIGSLAGTGFVNLGGRTLAVGGNNLATEFAGVLRDGGLAGPTTGGSLSKVGTGTFTLSGANTYTGNTQVTGGTLVVNGAVASPLVTVMGGTTLRGTGTLSGQVQPLTGATIAPGTAAATGTLTIGELYAANSNPDFNFRLGTAGNDRIDVLGNVTLAGTVNVAASGTFAPNTYRLINYGGTLAGPGLTLGGIPAGLDANDFAIDTGTTGQINLLFGGGSAVLYWDGAGTTANGVVDGRAGTWNNATTNWTNTAGSFNRNWAGKSAVFGGPAGGIVNVTDNVTTTGIRFSTNGYVINANPGTGVTLSGNVSVLADTGTLTTINAPLTGTGKLLKDGPGGVTLAGNSTYSGGTDVNLGSLSVTNPDGLGLGTGEVRVFPQSVGRLGFRGNGSAGTLAVANLGSADASLSAFTQFTETATAGAATFENQGSTANGANGGGVLFFNGSSAGGATFNNRGSLFTGVNGGGQIQFQATSTAGHATIFNDGGRTANTEGGQATFFNGADAGTATILNRGGAAANALSGSTLFTDTSSAAGATIVNRGSNLAAAFGGTTDFSASARAGTAHITAEGGTVNGALTSFIRFDGTSSADTATLDATSGTANGAAGGTIAFYASATASTATINAQGSGVSNAGGGTVLFNGSSTAGNAVFTNGGGSVGSATGGKTVFNDSSTAGSGAFTNQPPLSAAGGQGETIFSGNSTAGHATIFNAGGVVAGAGGSETMFGDTATAADATITSEGGTVANARGGFTLFFGPSNAGRAALIANGAAANGGQGGYVTFADSSSADNATLTANGGTNGGAGGLIVFLATSSGSVARAILNAGGGLDISGLSSAGTTLGSVEGAGRVLLGGKTLTVGGSGLSTTFAGLLTDGGGGGGSGGRLGIAPGTLTLSGANLYTGQTVIGNGGKLIAANTTGSATGSGPVVIQNGGTLSGSGRIAGPVTLNAGGAIVPGDPVTLTFGSDLTWDGGSVIRLVLGADQANSDRLDILGALIRGDLSAGNRFVFDLVDGGAVVGQTYDFLHFDSLVGFSAADFTFTGFNGSFTLTDRSLDFTISGVPEPTVAWLLLPGALTLAGVLRRCRRGPGHSRGNPLSSQ